MAAAHLLLLGTTVVVVAQGMRVSVVVPTHNERENISPLIQATLQHVPDAEIIVVDDDSPDGTSDEVTSRWGHDSRVRLIRRIGERGLTSALADGMAAARGERIAWLDADFNMDPSFLPALYNALDGADVAVASRYVPGEDGRESRLRVWGLIGANFVARTPWQRRSRLHVRPDGAGVGKCCSAVRSGGTTGTGITGIDLLFRIAQG